MSLFMQLSGYGYRDVYLTSETEQTHFQEEYRQNRNYSLPDKILYKEKYMLVKLNLTSKNIECPVTFNNLSTPRCKYITCGTCNYNFYESVYENWVKIYKKCPHCRSEWIYNKQYINEDSRTNIINYIIIYINIDKNEMREDEIFNDETGIFTIIDEDADNIEYMKEN